MANQIKGVVYEALKEQNGTSKAGNQWRKLTFSIIVREWRDTKLAFEVWGDMIDQISYMLHFGNEVVVDYFPESRRVESNDGVKYYTTMKAVKVDLFDPKAAAPVQQTAQAPAAPLPNGTSAVGQLISQHMAQQPQQPEQEPATEPDNGLPF